MGKKRIFTAEEIKIIQDTFDENKISHHLFKELNEKGLGIGSYGLFFKAIEEYCHRKYDGKKRIWILIEKLKNENRSEENKQQVIPEVFTANSEDKKQIQSTSENSESTSDIGQGAIAILQNETSSPTPSLESPIPPIKEPNELLDSVDAIFQKLESLEKLVNQLIKKNALENQKIEEQRKTIIRLYAGNKSKKTVSINEEIFNEIKDIMPQVCPVKSSNASAIVDSALFMAYLLIDPSIKKKNNK